MFPNENLPRKNTFLNQTGCLPAPRPATPACGLLEYALLDSASATPVTVIASSTFFEVQKKISRHSDVIENRSFTIVHHLNVKIFKLHRMR